MTRVRLEVGLWAAQRASAAILGVCVCVHLATIIYATHAGLSAAEILARTRGNVAWLVFYTLFVAAAAIHAPIGLRSVVREMTVWRGATLDGAMAAFGAAIIALGWRAGAGLF